MRNRASVVAVVAACSLSLLAGAALADPPTPPPNVAGTTSEPPPAWFAANGREAWFAYSSFCWSTACVDFLPPARRTDLPRATLSPGQVLRIHLRFIPKWVLVRNLETKRSYPLIARRDTSWRVRGRGIVLVEARGAKGSAGYLVRITG